MQSLRQLGGGVIIALISVVLVIGGISLALAETLPSQATPTPLPPTLSLEFPTATFTVAPLVVEIVTETPTPTVMPSATNMAIATNMVFATNTLFVQGQCSPPSGWVRIFTASGDTIYTLAQRYKTTAESLSIANCLSSFDIPAGLGLYVPPVPTVTAVPCGAPAGYVKNHVVQPGDNLYRIALSYGITFQQLQRANCMGSSTTIYAGQRLWVPNIPTRTPVPGVTTIPDFPTATNTSVPTDTTIPPTATPTSTPTVEPTFTASNTPVTPNP